VEPGGDTNVLASQIVNSKNSETSTVASVGETKESLVTG
jgi:hypothetical protein